MTADVEREIRLAFDATRRSLPAAARVVARRNRTRLASLTRPGGGPPVLNLASAVVAAGEEAWAMVAPALEGDRSALRRLRLLTRAGMEADRRADRGARPPAGDASPRRIRCHGTPAQRRFLATLVAFVRETGDHGGAIPAPVEVRISTRMTSALGLYRHRGDLRWVTVAERLFRPGSEDVLLETVAHELAHLADHATNATGRTSHGPEWREWARRLGARPARLASPEVLRRVDAAAARAAPPAAPLADGSLDYPPEVGRWLETREVPEGREARRPPP